MELLIHRWSSLVPSCIPPYVCGDWCELDDIPKQPFLPATTELVPGRSLRSCCVAFFILTWVAPLFLLGSWPRHLVFLIATTGFVSETLYATSHRVGLWAGSVKGEGGRDEEGTKTGQTSFSSSETLAAIGGSLLALFLNGAELPTLPVPSLPGMMA